MISSADSTGKDGPTAAEGSEASEHQVDEPLHQEDLANLTSASRGENISDIRPLVEETKQSQDEIIAVVDVDDNVEVTPKSLQTYLTEWFRDVANSEISKSLRSFLWDIFDESETMIQNVAKAYNISSEPSSYLAFIHGVYAISKIESSRLSRALLEKGSEMHMATVLESSRLKDSLAETFPSNSLNTTINFLSGICNVSKTELNKVFDIVAKAYNISHTSQESDTDFSVLHLMNSPFSVILAIIFLFVAVKFIRQRLRMRRRRVQFDDPATLGNIEGTKILRSTRDRSSTYDFFGMHLNRARNERNSFDDNSRGRSMSHDTFGPPEIKRERIGSMDMFYSKAKVEAKSRTPGPKKNRISSNNTPVSPQEYVKSQLSSDETGEEEGFLYDEFGLVTLSFEIQYYGPAQKTMKYHAFTPPHAWAEASRRIIPQEINMRLKRDLLLDLSEALIHIQEPTSNGQFDYQLATADTSIFVVPPAVGGVLNLYTKESKKEDWNEFTFESSQCAAQFQLDLLAHQVIGKSLRNIFEVLCLVHQGSDAYDGQEFVLHQERCVEEEQKEDSDPPLPKSGCVAWDDAMRALSSIPTIRIALERLWLSHRRPANIDFDKDKLQPEETVDENGLITEEYMKKRMLLGPVDFFRLFVPILPSTAVPQTESNMLRMEQLLSWRKRAARAAVLVRAYSNSRRVVNLGWNLPQEGDGSEEVLRRRLAYDDNEDNNRRDMKATNEYYEASVSRDVLCHVRPFDFFSKRESQGSENTARRSLVLSPYQAYSLVGMHVFDIPEQKGDTEHPLNIHRDPVEVFPSLAELITENPDLDFAVMSFFNTNKNHVYVFCYVRSLSKGIDPQFDKVIERFVGGSKELRDRKVHAMIQLGQRFSLSFGGWLFLKAVTLYLGFTRGRGSPLGLEATKDRCPLPSMRLADYAETHHFGGALQKNSSLPKNYISLTAGYESKILPSVISRLLFSLFKKRLYARAMDFTFVLEGEKDDELPERALCTTRVVHLFSDTVAQSTSPLTVEEASTEEGSSRMEAEISSLRRWARHSFHHAIALFSPMRDALDSVAGQNEVQGVRRGPSPRNPLRLDSDDPIEMATNDVIDILEGLDLPVGKAGIGDAQETTSVLSDFSFEDIQRFLFATEGDIKQSCLRIIETAKWRGEIFPIDKRKCKIELQSGQFFQQGFDRLGYPVFYFRNMCLGPWRQDVDASLAAVVYRLDEALSKFSKDNPFTKVTVIVLAGRPVLPGDVDDFSEESSSEEEYESSDEVDSSEESDDETNEGQSHTEADNMPYSGAAENDPRVSTTESFQLHTNKILIERLSDLLSSHYPERLHRVLVFAGNGKNFYYSSALKRRSGVKKLLRSRKLRSKVRFVDSFLELRKFVSRHELVSIVGGKASIESQVFRAD